MKHRFARSGGRAIWLAGMWDRCAMQDDCAFSCFTTLTGPSAGWLDYHDRPPHLAAAPRHAMARSIAGRRAIVALGSPRAPRTRGLTTRRRNVRAARMSRPQPGDALESFFNALPSSWSPRSQRSCLPLLTARNSRSVAMSSSDAVPAATISFARASMRAPSSSPSYWL